MLHFLDQFNAVIGVLLFSAYLYQVFYTASMACRLSPRQAESQTPQFHPIPPLCRADLRPQ